MRCKSSMSIAFYVNSRITRNAIQVIVTHGR